jgi:hypothetical protein
MTYQRGAGTLEAKVTECLHTLAPKAIERTGTSLHQLRRYCNPMKPDRLPFEVAARLDGELIRAGHAPLFRQAFDELVAAQTGGASAGGVTVQGLSQALLHLGGELGELDRAAHRAMENGQLSKQDRATLAKEAQDVMDGAQEIRDAVEPPYADVQPLQRRAN